ncbi:hypothetical protein PIB30_007890 [Stylosanthes scabra]|uniref:Uncharacterized protein n=1 Tax=Stylosanthes scabra TaxID=79078 RepID=A0ABU6R4Q2_9FABA|nr:hypothetical protein [Stylosanthes scabra]
MEDRPIEEIAAEDWREMRYLVLADRFHNLPPDEIPVEATQRQLGPHSPRLDVSHVPDNRRPARRMMVGTRTTARDWQWLDDMLAVGASAAPPTQKNRRIPLSYGCRRGASRPREAGELTQGTTIPLTMSSPSQQAFLDALHSPGFEQLMSDIMHEGGSAYKPDTQFDGSPVHLDLNEPMFGPSHLFMTLGGTPPSASHMSGASWTYHLWSLRVCQLLQCHLHRLSSQASQEHQGRPAELRVVEGAAPKAICDKTTRQQGGEASKGKDWSRSTVTKDCDEMVVVTLTVQCR